MHGWSGNKSNPIVCVCLFVIRCRFSFINPNRICMQCCGLYSHLSKHTHFHTFHTFFWSNAMSNDFQICVNFIEIAISNLCTHTHTRICKMGEKRTNAHIHTWREWVRAWAIERSTASKMKRIPISHVRPTQYTRAHIHYNHIVCAYIKLLCVKYDRTQFHIHQIKWFEAHLAFIHTWYSIQIYMLYQYKYLLVWWGGRSASFDFGMRVFIRCVQRLRCVAHLA